MPHVTVVHGPQGNPICQVGGRSFVFFRTARPDATDPRTGRRYTDVIMFWVPSNSGQPDQRAHAAGADRNSARRLARPRLAGRAAAWLSTRRGR
jgi:hypothetical protein